MPWRDFSLYRRGNHQGTPARCAFARFTGHRTFHHHRHFRIDLPTSIRIRRRLFKWINPLDVSINSGVRSVIGNTSVEYEFSFDPLGSFPREKEEEENDSYSSLILIIRISLYLFPLKLIFYADLEGKRKCFSEFFKIKSARSIYDSLRLFLLGLYIWITITFGLLFM